MKRPVDKGLQERQSEVLPFRGVHCDTNYVVPAKFRDRQTSAWKNFNSSK